jgi:peroxiredoxin
MNRFPSQIVALAVVSGVAQFLFTQCWAQDDKPLAEQVAAVKQAHAELEKWFYAELRAAMRDNKKVSDANKKYREGKLKHVAVLRPLIDENPTDPAAFDAALLLVGDMSYPLSDQQTQIVLDHHAANPEMGKLCFELRHREGEEWARKILVTAAEKHPERSVRGQATFSLGDYHRLWARPFGDPPPKDVAERHLGKAGEYYQQTVKEFDDITTPDGKWNLGKRAEHELARLRNLANLQVGRPAPPIAGTDLEGKPLKLEDYRGKVVVVVFWGSWCGPCMAKVPHERELAARLKGKPFALLGVSCGDTIDLARETAKKHEMTWPSWYDGDETRSGPIQTDYDIQHWPSVFVIDAEGIIQAIDVHGPELDAAVDKAMAALP